jgi:hypothetical protein
VWPLVANLNGGGLFGRLRRGCNYNIKINFKETEEFRPDSFGSHDIQV